jgi:amino acid transporter
MADTTLSDASGDDTKRRQSVQSASTSTPPKKLLGLGSAVALVLANTIGSGVFVTSGFALGDLGSREWVLIAWVIGGIYALSGVAIYADLSRRFPKSGGEYALLEALIGPVTGVAAGWVSLIAGFTTPIAAAALSAQLYLEGALGTGEHRPWIATALIFAVAALHAWLPRGGLLLQNTGVTLKSAIIFAFIVLGAWAISGNRMETSSSITAPAITTLAGSLMWISYAYSGWNAAIYVVEDVGGGGKSVQRALYIGTALVMVLYVGVSAVILFSAPIAQLRGIPNAGAIAASALGGPRFSTWLSAVISLALFTSVSSMTMTGPRVYARMAKDGTLPKFFAATSTSEDGSPQPPRFAIFAQAAASAILVWLSGLRGLLEFAGVTLALSAGAVVAGWLYAEIRAKTKRPLLLVCGVTFVTLTAAVARASFAMRRESAIATVAMLALAFVVAKVTERLATKSKS